MLLKCSCHTPKVYKTTQTSASIQPIPQKTQTPPATQEEPVIQSAPVSTLPISIHMQTDGRRFVRIAHGVVGQAVVDVRHAAAEEFAGG